MSNGDSSFDPVGCTGVSVSQIAGVKRAARRFCRYIRGDCFSIGRKVAKRLSPTPEAFVIGVFQDGQLVGNVGFKREKGKKLQHKAVIWGMYVAPEVRRQGVGKALLNEMIGRAREMEGLEQLILTVNAENEPARQLYRSIGFRVFATEPRAMKEGNRYVDEDHMILLL